MAEAAAAFVCRNCRNPLALRKDLISKNFYAKSGQAYLFSHVTNIRIGEKEDRQLITGLFSVGDIFCRNCGQALGWKYFHAYDALQKFKEGKLIVEKLKIAKEY
ncbi:hypothetical protein ACFE04_006680 [Oxalis oulophora]